MSEPSACSPNASPTTRRRSTKSAQRTACLRATGPQARRRAARRLACGPVARRQAVRCALFVDLRLVVGEAFGEHALGSLMALPELRVGRQDGQVSHAGTRRVNVSPVQQLRPGLSTWTAPHPDWAPDSGGPEGWEQEVRSYAYDAGDRLVLLDPISPPPPVHEQAAGKDVIVLLTCGWHARSARDLVEPLGAMIRSPAGGD